MSMRFKARAATVGECFTMFSKQSLSFDSKFGISNYCCSDENNKNILLNIIVNNSDKSYHGR